MGEKPVEQMDDWELVEIVLTALIEKQETEEDG